MQLNIISAGVNSVGNELITSIQNPDEKIIALSRRGTAFDNALNLKVSDLTHPEETREALLNVFAQLPNDQIDHIKFFHNCCYAICEIPNIERDFPEHAHHPKLKMRDEDGDGIDDRTYHSLLTTFRNVLAPLLEYYPDKKISLGTICSLTDKKDYIPTVFQSMVKANNILRDSIEQLVFTNKNIHGVVVSASTVKTKTEENFRKYCEDKEFRVPAELIATTLHSIMHQRENKYIDIPVYVHHPRYEEYYKNETDEEMTERLKQEV
jgi:hypothetical protein